jgi:hypothetical protein
MLTRLLLACAAWLLAACPPLDVHRSNTAQVRPTLQLVAADRGTHASDAVQILALEPCDPARLVVLFVHGAAFPQATLFVSLSTPWAGEPLAELGVRLAPMHPPEWADLVPGSRTLRRLFASLLPEHVRHVLFSRHKGGDSILPGNRDGAVTLASQLDHRAQREAVLVVGFDEDHEGILESAQVFERYAAALGATYRGMSEAPAR